MGEHVKAGQRGSGGGKAFRMIEESGSGVDEIMLEILNDLGCLGGMDVKRR